MANLSKLSLPLGYRFLPYDVELVMYYLKRKVAGRKFKLEGDIPDIVVENYSPSEIREMSYPKTKYPERFFFSSLGCRYSKGQRKNRSAKDGFWKPTGKDKPIPNKFRKVGWRRTLTFYLGKAPGTLTDWHMHEYGLEGKNEFVMCKIFENKSRGPKTDEEYESPVEDDADESSSIGPMKLNVYYEDGDTCNGGGSSQVDSVPNKSTGEDVDTPEIDKYLEDINASWKMEVLSQGLPGGFLEEEDLKKPMEDEEGSFKWEDFFIPMAADGSNHGTSDCLLAANVTPVLPANENEFVMCKIFENKSRGPKTDEEYESPVEDDADESSSIGPMKLNVSDEDGDTCNGGGSSQVDSVPNKSTGEDVDTPEIDKYLEDINASWKMEVLSRGLPGGFLEEEDLNKPMEDEEGSFKWEDFFIPMAADGSNHGTSDCLLAANVTPVLPANEAMDSCDYENIPGYYREPTCDSAAHSPLKAGEIVGPYAPQSLARGKQLNLHLGLECISKEGWLLSNVQFLLGSIFACPASATVYPSSLDYESYRVGCGFSCSIIVKDEVTIICTNDGLLGMSRSFPFWSYFDLAEMLVMIGTISVSIDFMFVFILSAVSALTGALCSCCRCQTWEASMAAPFAALL